ncbi:MAG: EAL domain-containing protein [Sulfuricella sp.]|nr:EAL domain-containing protein [Sulfuricella sp.]
MKYQLSELVDLPELQKLMESLYRATGINHALIDNDSKVLTAVGWQKICTDFHRIDSRTCERCLASDQYILSHLNDGPYVGYDCPNGLVDYATPVVIDGEHVANIFTGQMFHHAPDMQFFRGQAEEFGFDEAAYLDAVKQVKVIPRERMPDIMAFLEGLAHVLANKGLARVRQLEAERNLRQLNDELSGHVQENTRELMENNRLLSRERQALQQEKQVSDDIIDSLPGVFYMFNEHERLLRWNYRFPEVTGYTDAELSRMHSADFFEGDDKASIAATVQQVFAAGESSAEAGLLTKGGRKIPYYFSGRRTTIAGKHYLVGLGVDITERKAAEMQINFLAHHDPLTELPNRLLIRDRFKQARAYADRGGTRVALLFLDLDHFKTINDSLGHTTGDALLKAVASRLRECVRDTDTISRQGGDEFLIVLADVSDTSSITSVAAKILERLAEPFEFDERDLSTSVSVGAAVYPDDGEDFDTLLKKADTAMYQAKEAGRNACRFFDRQMNLDADERYSLRNSLRLALERGEFALHYQPQIDLAGGAVIGAEALIRWNHPELGLIAPGRFIPLAEDSGLIVPIGEWVLREACRQAVAWQKAGLPELVVAANLSAVQFKRGKLEHTVMAALSESGLDPAFLELELTESILIKDTENVLQTVRHLKSLGVKLSIDDFGTGYSSLAYLKRFAVDKVKVDQSFIRDLATDPNDAAIVRAIIQMARSLGLRTIAEGVEEAQVLDYLRIYHCDESQGYHIGRPMPADEFAAYVADARAMR